MVALLGKRWRYLLHVLHSTNMSKQENRTGKNRELELQTFDQWKYLFDHAIFVRHCRTALNDAGRLQGSIDSPLSEIGKMEAQELTRHLQNQIQQPISRIFSSPMKRASETAKIFASINKPVTTIEYVPNLREISFGNWEGKKISNLEKDKQHAMWLLNPLGTSIRFNLPPHGDLFLPFLLRANQAATHISERLRKTDDEQVLIISHATTIRGIRFLGLLAKTGLQVISLETINEMDRNFFYASELSKKTKFIRIPHGTFRVNPSSLTFS